ncbi:50S ribosomal protein L13 [uncultured archaeon]|nr:50S ribosomal protein L13 [uncultured archaeon]
MKTAIIDASNAVAGRLSTVVAKRLLKGETIDVINAEKAVMTGNAEATHLKYKTRFGLAPKGNPRYGPKFSRMPHMILKTVIRGMLPWKETKGKIAFDRLRCHIGVPEELAGKAAERIEKAENRREKGFILVEDVSKRLGAKW